MESVETKIKRVMRTAGVLNWARQNYPRYDRTRLEVLKMADNPPRRSLRTIDRHCRDLANRSATYEEIQERCGSYTGYLRMAADEVIPAFHDYFTANQIETLPELCDERFLFPIGKDENGKTRTIPVSPTFYAIRGETLLPTFVLAWATVPYTLYQMRLISSIIFNAILTRQGYIGGDAMVLTFPRDKWKTRRPASWLVSRYADMDVDALQTQFDRYNRAVSDVVAELKGRS